MMDYILTHPWLGALVIFISQLTYMYLRTLNVIYTSEINMKKSLITGFGLDVSWLISMSIGLSSIMMGNWQPVVAFIIGATLGRIWGLWVKNKNKGNV